MILDLVLYYDNCVIIITLMQFNLFVHSLTLNKLQQKRMLEEKLAQKRARQMEKLQKKQNMVAKVSS